MFDTKYGLEQAVIERRKTMTRRIIPFKVSNYCDWKAFEEGYMKCYGTGEGDWVDIRRTAKYKVGEVVAVAQSYKTIHEEMMNGDYGDSRYDAFRCAMVAGTKGWDNKMFVRADLMPHQIRITDLKVERLQDISEEDCLLEGIQSFDTPFGKTFVAGGVYVGQDARLKIAKGMINLAKPFKTPQEAFAVLIDRVSGKGTWERNRYMYVYAFELVK